MRSVREIAVDYVVTGWQIPDLASLHVQRKLRKNQRFLGITSIPSNIQYLATSRRIFFLICGWQIVFTTKEDITRLKNVQGPVIKHPVGFKNPPYDRNSSKKTCSKWLNSDIHNSSRGTLTFIDEYSNLKTNSSSLIQI